MGIFRHYRIVISTFFVILVLIAPGTTAIAQQDESATVPEQASPPEQDGRETLSPNPELQPASEQTSDQRTITLEQITVTGQRSFFSLRAQIEDAKEALYSSYNDLNLDDDLDVNCRQSDWTGTHIREQVCWPVFFERAVSENSQDYLRGIAILEPVSQLQSQYQSRFEDLRSNLVKVASENPEVEDALMELGTLEAAYEKKREECMEQTPFLLIFRICH